jgi:hypothetical protein
MIYVRLNAFSFCLAMVRRIILPASLILCLGATPIVQVANAQSPNAIFDCSGFATSGSSTGTCEATIGTASSPYFIITGATGGSSPGISGSSVLLMPAACQHCALALNYQQLVNIQQFQATFTFVSNGWNVAFVAQNSNNNSVGNLANFSAGAGCEGGFFQGFAQAVAPNNIFALMLDSYSGLIAGSSTFTYSGVQYYQGAFASNAPNPPGQSPCNPNLGGTDFTYAGVNKVSTFPVPLNSPPNATFQTSTSGVGTGDTYSVTITYDGNNLTISMFDVTAGGSCPSATMCFTNTWTGVNIPSMVGGNTAYIGLVTSTADNDSSIPLLIHKFSYFSGYRMARTHDFNADGKTDIAWRDTSNGASSGTLSIWQMNGTGVLNAGATLVGTVSYPSWTIIGLGDFNGDGHADILWRDTSGDLAIWEMNGTQVINSGETFVASVTGWSVVGIGDFNGDGKADLLWTDGNGNYAIWEMNGTQILNSGATHLAKVSTNWTVVGVGDFNGDGKSDILWEDQLGEYAIWEMNGTQIVNSVATFAVNVSTNWQVIRIGDFNGDGKSDMLWTDGNGNYAIWEINGMQVINPNATFAVTGWSVVGTGDYNGDGHSDILWTDGKGNYAIWETNGTTIINFNAVYLTNVSTNWAVQLPLGQ